MELKDLTLLVRALHSDVSTLDDRLRTLERMVLELREAMVDHDADLIVIPGADARPRGA